MNSLKLEGAKDNIQVNAICPVAATRMTEALMPPAVLEMLKPEFVSPAVAYLASDEAPTGTILTAAAGVFAAAQIDGDGRRQSRHPCQRRRYRGAFRANLRLVDGQALRPGRRAERQIPRPRSGKAGSGLGHRDNIKS